MFTRDGPGRLTPIGSGASKYSAFIPNPLPPRVELDADTLLLLSQADQSLGQLAGIGHFVKNSTLLVKPLVRREAVLSSQIEGTQSGLDDLYRYEADQLLFPTHKGSADNEDVHEVLNYVVALEYGVHRLESLPVSTRLIRELHRHLMKGVRGERATPGELRTTQNWIRPAGCTLNDATYVPPPVDAMTDGLGEVERYIHNAPEYPQLIRLALVHYSSRPFIHSSTGMDASAVCCWHYWQSSGTCFLHRCCTSVPTSTATETLTITFSSVSARAASGSSGSDSSSLQSSANHTTR